MSKIVDDHEIRPVLDLIVQILDAMNQRTQYFLYVGTRMMANVPWIAFTLALDKAQDDLRELVPWVV